MTLFPTRNESILKSDCSTELAKCGSKKNGVFSTQCLMSLTVS